MPVRPFVNETSQGNERALKKGRRVPNDGIPLSYVQAPRLSPEDNIVIVDTSRAVEDNIADTQDQRAVYYANSLGILMDEDDNAVIADDKPLISDIFALEEDSTRIDEEDLTPNTVLPFLHVSRHFHLETAGLTMGNDLLTFDTDQVRVVNTEGEEYLDSNGGRRYKVKIVSAVVRDQEFETWSSPTEIGSLVAWWDPFDFTELNANDPVDTWTDSSGLRVDLTQDDENLQPTWQAGRLLQGPSVEFDGDSNLTTTSTDRWDRLHDGSEHTIAFTFRADEENAGRLVSTLNTLGGGTGTIFTLANNATAVRRVVNNSGTAIIDDQVDIGDYDINIVVSRLEYDADTDEHTHTLWVNDNQISSTITDTFASGASSQETMTMGAMSNSDHSNAFVGQFGELIVVDRAISDNESSALRTWLVAKYRDVLEIADATEDQPQGKDDWAYRVHVYIDTDQVDDLRLQYNKVELRSDGTLDGFNTNWEERLNPVGFYEYRPEEAEIVDPDNRQRRIFSSKPINQKERVLGDSNIDVDGYKVYVPKKAVGDPRIYQLFRWRIKCTFVKENVIDIGRVEHINCGIVVTNNDLSKSTPSHAPYAFFNLAESLYNITNVSLRNPLRDNHSQSAQTSASYWYVNIDEDDITEFDFLIWTPTQGSSANQYMTKVDNFVREHNGTILIEYPPHYDSVGGIVGIAGGMRPNGTVATPGTDQVSADATTLRIAEDAPEFFEHADANLGGWSLYDGFENLYDTVSYVQNTGGDVRYFESTDVYTPLLEVQVDDSWSPVMAMRPINNGRIIHSTIGTAVTCSRIFSYLDGSQLSTNTGSTIADIANYYQHIDSSAVEGAMKTLFNLCLTAARGRALELGDEDEFSTVWTLSTPWEGSWVIDGTRELLSERERQEHRFSLEPRDLTADEPDDTPTWKRRLSPKTVETLIDEELQHYIQNPGVRARVDGAARSYEIEITNPRVEVSDRIFGADYPWAWTTAYSPRFTVPPDIGPHVIRHERTESGRMGVEVDYDELTYSRTLYPEREYGCYIVSSYATSEQDLVTTNATWTAQGTALHTYQVEETEIVDPDPQPEPEPEPGIEEREVVLTWWNAPQTGTRQWVLTHPTDSQPMADVPRTRTPYKYLKFPHGIRTWQLHNYYTNNWGPGHKNWPFYGQHVRAERGSTGDHVKFIQEALNRFMDARFIPSSMERLRVDGIYGPNTEHVVTTMQEVLEADYVDGAVEAETWAIIGNQILRGRGQVIRSTDGGDWTHWFNRVPQRMSISNASNGQTDNWYAKRSWFLNGPRAIWDLFQIVFDRKYEIVGVTVVPYMDYRADTDSIIVKQVDVRNQPFTLRNYDPNSAMINNLNDRPRDNEEHFIPVDNVEGNTLIVGVGQDQGSGWGTSRMFGVRDIRAHAVIREEAEVPAAPDTEPVTRTITRTVKEIVDITDSGNVSVESFTDEVRQAQPSSPSKGELSRVQWDSVSVDDPKVNATIDSNGKMRFSSIVLDYEIDPDKSKKGPNVPDDLGVFYGMNANHKITPSPEEGYVSRRDGTKLLCDQNKHPVGFPGVPDGATGDGLQHHYVKYNLVSDGSHPSVEVDFFDAKRDEYVVDENGKSSMTFVEYMRRGPDNVFIAVSSDYKRQEERALPDDSDAPLVPQKWAYPAYGVYARGASRIRVEPLTANLSVRDMWPLAIRDGRFTRTFKLSEHYDDEQLPGYLSDYKGDEVEAVYSLPETKDSGFSLIYGPPWADIKGEIPEILAQDVVRVRQTPIMMLRHPTVRPTEADPAWPVVELQVRDDIDAPWQTLSLKDFADWNVRTGEIFLKQPLGSLDRRLIRAYYTVERRHHYIKSFQDEVLNLNPYSNKYIEQFQFEGKGLYVYIIPHYVRDSAGELILDSVADEAVKVTTDPTIFDPTDPDYNPTAIMIGVVYVIPGTDPDDISMFDVRRRGGGVRDNADLDEVTRVTSDALSYWDISTFTGTGYQEGGLIVIRLPEELRDRFSAGEIKEIASKNIAAGVGLRIEDMQGRAWEEGES